MPESLLVTGGCGFIGANFVRYWAEIYPNDQIIVLDKLTYAADKNALNDLDSSQVRLVVGDICDEKLVAQLFGECDLTKVVHFAAETHVDRSIENPTLFTRTNVIGTHVLLEQARKHWIGQSSFQRHRFHHVSTDEVFGSLTDTCEPFHEGTLYQPNSPYSASKAASDHLVRSYYHTYGLNVTTTHCSNNFGPGQDQEKLLPKVIQKALTGEVIPIYGAGKNIRDWLFVRDHCVAIDKVMQHAPAGEVYCIGGRNELRNIDLVKSVCAAIDRRFHQQPELAKQFPACPAAKDRLCESLIAFVEDRKGHDWRYAINDRKLRDEFNLQTPTAFDQALEVTLDFYLSAFV